MKSRNLLWVCLCILAATAVCLLTTVQAEEDAGEVHLKGDNVGFMWTTADGTKMNWDINSNGQVTNGTNGAYNGGVILALNGGNAFNSNGTARLSKDKREIEIGPWQWNGINISRRVYVDPKLGYCRWIDIYENASGSDQTLNLRYTTNLTAALKEIVTSSGAKQVNPKKDWALASITTDANKPVTVHIFGSRGAKDLPSPEFAAGKADTYYNYNLTVPNGKAVALCFFESQQPNAGAAVKFMKEFDPQTELGKAPAALRKLVINIVAPRLTLESIDLPRNDKLDMVVQPDGNELLGTLTNDKFTLDTIFGKLELKADKVVGLNVPAADDPYIQAVLVDGQVVAGKLASDPLKLKLENGSEMSFAPEKLKCASYRISKEKPQEMPATNPLLVLRSGQRLFFNAAEANCAFRSVYGELKLDPAAVTSITTETPDGGLHRVVFRNGTILSGLVTPDKFTFKLDLGMPLEIGLSRISRFEYRGGPPADTTNLSQATLRNEDEVWGKLLDPTIDVQTENGKIALKTSEIVSFDMGEGGILGQAEIKLRNRTTINGKVLNRALKFKIEPGPEVSVPVGLLQTLTVGGVEPLPATAPATGPAPTPTPAPTTTTPPNGPRPAVRIMPIRRMPAVMPPGAVQQKVLQGKVAE